MLQHFKNLALYNRWANERLFKACSQCSEVDDQTRLHRILNDLLIADRIWLARLKGQDHGIQSLDQVLYTTFTRLVAGRRTTDEEIIDWLEDRTEAHLDERCTYQIISGPKSETTTSVSQILTHMFLHQTLNRGRACEFLSAAQRPVPPLDYIQYCKGRQS